MSREHIARLIIQPTCPCGWSGSMAGFTAVQHSVEYWVEERFNGSSVADTADSL